MKISAILTTYQRPALARRALQSILAQTFPPTQIVVVEDGSATWFREWVASLGNQSIEYVCHDVNQGLAAARNTGLRAARHPFVAYLDDDDYWLPTRLEEQISCWQTLAPEVKERTAAIQVGCKIVDENERLIGLSMPVNRGPLRESIMEKGAATPSSSFLFTRASLLAIRGFDEDLLSGIDHDIWMKLAVAGYSSEAVEKPLVIVHRDAGQTMMSNTRQRIAGVEQYVRKWAPTYAEWFGCAGGDAYARRYAIRVISRLAGEKLASRRFHEAYLACKTTLGWTANMPKLLGFAAGCLIRSATIPAVRRLRIVACDTLRHA